MYPQYSVKGFKHSSKKEESLGILTSISKESRSASVKLFKKINKNKQDRRS